MFESRCFETSYTKMDLNKTQFSKNIKYLVHNIYIWLQSLKRHVTVCHTKEEEQDDPLAFELCLCCGEPVDSAHTVRLIFVNL